MGNNSEYNKNETLKFIELTKEALTSEEKLGEWNSVRAMYGIYPERDRGTYMLRPRFPNGKISLDDFKFFLHIGDSFGDKRIHLTTRQDIQLHGLKKENLPEILELLLDKGFSSRATGGNASRAVVVPPMTGFEDEVLDVSPYAEIITNHLLSSDNYMGLPRKYKIALSNNEKNSLYVKISDLGFLATEKNGEKGFKVYGAGGLGALSKEAIVLADFVKKEEILYHVVAMRNLFWEHGDRNNKARARIRYIALKLGEEEFRKLYDSYLNNTYQTEELKFEIPEERGVILSEDNEIKLSNNTYKSNVKGRYGYYYHPFGGDINLIKGMELIKLLENLDYPTELRITSSQGIVIRNLKGSDIKTFKGLNANGDKNLYKSVTCIGKTVCNLGILNSPLLLKDIFKYFKNKQRLASLLPTLRISGCPNSCGAHHIGDLGFWGKKKNGIPYYTIVAGGAFRGETVILNKNIGDIKATDIPKFLEDLAITLKNRKINYEELIKEKDSLENLLKNYGG